MHRDLIRAWMYSMDSRATVGNTAFSFFIGHLVFRNKKKNKTLAFHRSLIFLVIISMSSSAHCKSRIIGRKKICPILLEISFTVMFSKPAVGPVTKPHLSSGHLKGESCCFLSRLVISKMKGALLYFWFFPNVFQSYVCAFQGEQVSSVLWSGICKNF